MSVVARCRKDIVLCKRAPGQGRRFYGVTKFTPEEVRRRDGRARWQKAKIFHGGCYREARNGSEGAVQDWSQATVRVGSLRLSAGLGEASGEARRCWSQSAAGSKHFRLTLD